MSVRVERAGKIARISFSSEKANSLDSQCLHEIANHLIVLGADSGVQVIGLESEGSGAFCGGASFEEFQRLGSQAEAKDFFLGFASVLMAIREAPQFVITRAQGRAVGGGVGILAASDLVLAVSSAEVRLSELAIGIGPFVIGPFVERKMGIAAFQELTLATSWKSAAWAQEKGLFSSLVENVEALDRLYAEELERISQFSPEASHAVKRMFWQSAPWDSKGLNALLESRAHTVATLLLASRAKKTHA